MHASLYKRRFPWLRRSRFTSILETGIRFGETCRPPVYPNYWQHLPRVVLAASMLRTLTDAALKTSPRVAVLDLAASPPTAALLKVTAGLDRPGVEFRCATELGEPSALSSEVASLVMEPLRAPLGTDAVTLEAESADIVVFTEVIEHINAHPQAVFSQINRLLKPDGCLLLSTPNVCSRKKLLALSSGNWNFDSPTFSDSMGHRFEFSFFHIKASLEGAGFAIVESDMRDVFLDDPRGPGAMVQYYGLALLKLLTGHPRDCVRMLLRPGSTMFVVARKLRAPATGAAVRI